MNLEIKITADGSATLYSEAFNETYHSVNGAITESEHVFIQAGLHFVDKKTLNIFELGFGTGLNAFLTLREAVKGKFRVHYRAIELYPLNEEIYQHYRVGGESDDDFLIMHRSPWDKEVQINDFFILQKIRGDFQSVNLLSDVFDLVYFDAFSPGRQPELWTLEIFRKMWMAMKCGGILTTYCARGQVRRNMQQAGFLVERLPGPPGKREMLRAVKPGL